MCETRKLDAQRCEAKLETLAQNLAAELALLTDHAEAAFADAIHGRDWGRDSVRRALTALLVGLPVYRSYLDGGPPSSSDSAVLAEARASALADVEDRKSTRLNSSHVAISYAVFCLQKKKRRVQQP